MDSLERLASAFEALPQCTALAVSGSQTSLIHDGLSDWDIYIYTAPGGIAPDDRDRILSSLSSGYKVRSSFFEEGDEAVIDGTCFDMMYRWEDFIHGEIDRVWHRHQPSLGYSTCFLYNLATSSFIFDKKGIGKEIDELKGDYPDALASAIIDHNWTMSRSGSEGDWFHQLSAAVKRGDIVSRNHRLAATMASYFDMLFAYNHVLHPGEKKLVGYAHALCHELPAAFDADIEAVYSSAYDGDLIGAVTRAFDHLGALVKRT